MKRSMNPIWARELKERMRTTRSAVAITAFITLLGSLVFMTHRAISDRDRFGGGGFQSAVSGRIVFHFMLFALLMLICFVVPGYTAGSISAERERQTFHLVQVTMLRPRSIVLGKLAAAISYVVFLVVATVPLTSVSFVLGGVTPMDVVRGYAMVIFIGITLAAIGIAISSAARRTITATLLTYAVILLFSVGTVVGFGIAKYVQVRHRFDNSGEIVAIDSRNPMWTLVLNPFLGMASAIQGHDSGGASRIGDPLDGLFSFLSSNSSNGLPQATAEVAPVRSGVVFGRSVQVRTGPFVAPLELHVLPSGKVSVVPRRLRTASQLPVPPPQFKPIAPADPRPNGLFAPSGPPAGVARVRHVPFWAWTVGWYILISLGAFGIAVRRVRSPARKLWSGRQGRRARRRAALGEA